MQSFETAIIGAGASGIAAAIAAKRRGESVVMLEKTDRPGKKILASGNGRCNLLNNDLTPPHYNAEARRLVASVFARYGAREIAAFFTGIGVYLRDDGGRIFPATNQSATVLSALEREVTRLAIPVKNRFDIIRAAPAAGGFAISARSGATVSCKRLVIATGGKSYPSFGSDGSGYALAAGFGHTIIDPVPAAVPLVSKDRLCHLLQGQRIAARARAVLNGAVAAEAAGEILFTKYGLSGTAAIDVSRPLSIALHRGGASHTAVSIDLVPFIDERALASELAKRLAAGHAPNDILIGILPNKFGPALAGRIPYADPEKAASALKDIRFSISGTRGWNEADFTAGGVSIGEVHAGSLESRKAGGLYFCGEVLDVDGDRGGYNLGWAWASGFAAGTSGGAR